MGPWTDRSVSAAMSHKAQEAKRFRMNRNLEIRLPKVDGGHPIPLSDRQDGLHAEVRHVHEAIEERQVDDRMPQPRGLPNHKQAAVKAGRRKRSKLHSTLGNQSQGDLLERSPFDGSRGIRRHGDGFRRQRRRPEERYAIPLPEDLHHPRIRAPVPPGLPVEGQTAAGQGYARRWLLLSKTQRLRRRSRPLTTLEALAAPRTRRGRRVLPRPLCLTRRTVARRTGERRRRRGQRLRPRAGR